MTYRGLPADYDAWKTRSDRDDGPDDEFEPEPEDDMKEPADIAALVERLREYAKDLNSVSDRSGTLDYRDLLPWQAADALEALQAKVERLDRMCSLGERVHVIEAREQDAAKEVT